MSKCERRPNKHPGVSLLLPNFEIKRDVTCGFTKLGRWVGLVMLTVTLYCTKFVVAFHCSLDYQS